jgi:hypothetical protein
MYCKTRLQFSSADYEFIESVGGRRVEREPLALTEILHDRRLFQRAMTTPPMFLSISPHLFFYVFVYRALDAKHLADDDVVDYIAGVCVEYQSAQVMWHLGSVRGAKTVYLVDLFSLVNELRAEHHYHLRRYIGNVTLFLTGFFPDFIYQRSKKKGAPPLAYYERVGQMQFEHVIDQSYEYDTGAASVFSVLADRFVQIRMAINVFNDAYFKLRNPNVSLDTIERQIATLDDESLRKTLEL